MPIGRAPAWQSLMPLYCAGLCEAVNIAAGESRDPAAKYTRSVDASPMSMTSRPCSITPVAKASTSSGPLGRMSRPMSTRSVVVDELGETDTERVRDLRIELVGHRTSDVIRLDDLIQY